MTRGIIVAAVLAAVAPGIALHADGVESARYHYNLTARVRPLALFWISRSNVGDAVVTRDRAPGEVKYSLLIGSDPARAPFHVNRWGYIEEEIRGPEARLIGLMTASDEDSIARARAGIANQAAGHHPFKVIEGTADAYQASSRVASILTSEDYTIHHLPVVLDLVRRQSAAGESRVVRLGPDVRRGFLAALVDAMRGVADTAIPYVYYGRLYELKRTRSTPIADLRIGRRTYGPCVAAEFVSTSRQDGEVTRFSMTYGADGPLADVPLKIVYQPRWWMEIELTIDGESR
jgi:type IV secretory pathway protease TraF